MDSSSRVFRQRGRPWGRGLLPPPEQFVGQDHHRLGQVQGGAVPGGDSHQGMAQGEFLVGEPEILRPEEQGNVVLADKAISLGAISRGLKKARRTPPRRAVAPTTY